MGAGAVGTYYGALLARSGHDVTMVSRDRISMPSIVTTKSHDTLAARVLRDALPPGAPVLSLQNGVENVGRIASVTGAERALGGIAFVGVRVDEPGVVDHQAEGWVPGSTDGSWMRGVRSLACAPRDSLDPG